MDNKNTTDQLSKEMFERIEVDSSLQEKIDRPSLTFWQDAIRRLVKNKGAILGMIILAIIIVMAIIGPYMNDYTYDQQIQPLTQHNKLPPRVQGLEKLGIFDGAITKEVSERQISTYEEDEYKILKEYVKITEQSIPEASLSRYEEGTYEILEEIVDPDTGAVTYDIEIRQNVYRIKEYTYVQKGIEDEYFWFGTDDLARDIWTRVWEGTRISLLIGLLAAIIDMLIGVTFGSISGYYGGKVDMYMMRVLEIINGIPGLVILILFLLIMEPGIMPIAIAIAITGWMGMARVVRSQFLKLKSQEFVLAAKTLGTPSVTLIRRHLIPNIIGQVIIMITFSIPGAIFYEAFLAFIGLGVPAPRASLGVLINEGVKYLISQPSKLFIPALVLCFLMLSINIFANGLRDALDPKMRNH